MRIKEQDKKFYKFLLIFMVFYYTAVNDPDLIIYGVKEISSIYYYFWLWLKDVFLVSVFSEETILFFYIMLKIFFICCDLMWHYLLAIINDFCRDLKDIIFVLNYYFNFKILFIFTGSLILDKIIIILISIYDLYELLVSSINWFLVPYGHKIVLLNLDLAYIIKSRLLRKVK